MTNRELSVYINQNQHETRELFDSIRTAFEELNLGPVTKQIAELYLNGTVPLNYGRYLIALDARKLISEQGGFRMITAESEIKSGFFDPWVMLLSAAKYYLEEDLPEEFEDLVIKPIDERLKNEANAKEEKKAAIEKAKKAIEKVIAPLQQAYDEIENIPVHHIAGTEIDYSKMLIHNILEHYEYQM